MDAGPIRASAGELGSRFGAGALLRHARDQHWAKAGLEYSAQLRPTTVTVVSGGVRAEREVLQQAPLPG